MPASTALDPDYVLWSAPAEQRADRPRIVLLYGWTYDERHLFAFAHLFPQVMVAGLVIGIPQGLDRKPILTEKVESS